MPKPAGTRKQPKYRFFLTRSSPWNPAPQATLHIFFKNGRAPASPVGAETGFKFGALGGRDNEAAATAERGIEAGQSAFVVWSYVMIRRYPGGLGHLQVSACRCCSMLKGQRTCSDGAAMLERDVHILQSS
jgi:hypothetical protein